MVDLVVRGASIWAGDAWEHRDLAVRGGAVHDAAGDEAEHLDGAGLLVAPGFVDLQCNGALGIDLSSEPERLWELAAGLPRWGVTSWLPTLVSSPSTVIDRARATLVHGPPEGWTGARPLGLHLEGPFLAPARRGAHDASRLRSPDVEATADWSAANGIALVTLAPELPGAMDVVESLARRGVVVSLGHSDASAEVATEAVARGATWVTHLFNAMSPLGHREPGLASVALADERLSAGLIVDGLHVDPTVVRIAQRALGPRLTLVTDAVSALGRPEGSHGLGGVEVTAGDGGVRLGDGTLAGTNLSMDGAVRNLVAFSGCSPAEAVRAASAAPAGVIGDRTRGSLSPGARADFVLLDPDLEVVATFVGGREEYRRPPR